ncbi:unnamed protein product [Clonostachys byssicola]|uniref:Heterokaryon incompatibility domain-containing protein n=1 Tax=Clonostachys byssicola TaxID=160290 RepID=A0A9N9Y731_9HYPO|nr:unnamed protein product [Clonostachys byssicola]
MLPRSMSSRGDIITALDNLKVFVAEKVLLQWTLEPAAGRWTSHVTKGHHYDDGIQAAVLPPKGENGIQVYLEAGSNSHLPLDFTRRFAAICGIEDQENLVYFIFSQNDLSYIEDCLDRQGILAIDDIEDADFDGAGAEIDLGMATSWQIEIGESGSKNNASKDPGRQVNGEVVEKAKAVVDGTDDAQKTLFHHSNNALQAQTGVALDSGSANTHTYNPLDMPSTTPRPDYTTLSSHLNAPLATSLSSSRAKPASGDKGSTSHTSLTVLGRPRIIGAPTVVFVPSQEDLPLEDFSQSASSQNILPARAKISHSGACTVVIATSPETRSDPDVEFVGELFVSKLLEQHFGWGYDPERSWTSPLRNRAGYKKFEPSTDPMTSFTLKNIPAMTDLLIQAFIPEAEKWEESNPVYYIQVHTTVGEQESPFIMSAATLKMARECMISERSASPPKEVFILARVSDLFKNAHACFYIDPWKMYASGQMKIQPKMDSYVAKIEQPEPEIKFSDFADINVPEFLYRQRLENSMSPFSRFLYTYLFDGGAINPKLPSHEKYNYCSLKRGNIRLLELKPGREIDELEGSLNEFNLDPTIPPFQALSYAWGYSIKPFVVRVQGRVIGITASLYFALKRLRKPKQSVQLWVDAICIDQSDEKDGGKEKSAQIRLMPEIFQRATQVIVWVGEEMNEDSHVFKYFRELISVEAQGSGAATIADDSETWDSINKFFKRPWFQRVWIIQELVFASDVKVMAGKNESMSWDGIHSVARICFREAQKSTTNVTRQIAQNALVVLRLGELRHSYHEGEERNQPRLLTLFRKFQYAKATRARDKLFALLGLASDAAEKHFDPDYTDTLEIVVQKYAKVFVERGCAIEMLYRARFSSPRFPSWIPDWITNTPQRTITTWPSRQQGFSACTHIHSRIKLGSGRDNMVLIAKGHILDVVDEVGEKSFQTCDRIEYLQEVSRFVQKRESYPTGERIEDLVWKIPVGDSIEPTSPDGDTVNFRVAYQAFTEYLQLGEQGKDWKMEIMQARAMAKIKHFLFHPQELRQLLWPYLQTALEFAERFADAKACTTKKGYVGILPGKAQKLDKVVILHGSAVPFLVRERVDLPGYYIHLGECYIHGIMHGTHSSTSDLGVKEIRIS